MRTLSTLSPGKPAVVRFTSAKAIRCLQRWKPSARSLPGSTTSGITLPLNPAFTPFALKCPAATSRFAQRQATTAPKRTSSVRDTFNKGIASVVVKPVSRRDLMVELRFRIRNTVFTPPHNTRRSTIRPVALLCPSVEEAALLGEVDDIGRLVPRKGVFFMSLQRTGPVIEGFEDCALGEFVKAQLEALSQNGEPPARCEVHGLDPFRS